MFLTPVSKDITNIRLSNWAVVEADDGRHFLGIDQTDMVGRARVSTFMLKFDMTTMTGTTRSGRVYTLIGEPAGLLGRCLSLWEDWASINGIEKWKDVTEEYTSVAQ